MESRSYSDFYKTEFGQEILRREVDFLKEELKGYKKVLSVGCGPAIQEVHLANSNPKIELIGLDISKDMLEQALRLPPNLDLVLCNAQKLCLKNESIDLVYFLTSLEFISDVEDVLKDTKRVIKPNGRAIFMVANIKSWYVQKEIQEVDSYIRRNYENMDPEKLQDIISKYLTITSTDLMLGIHEKDVFESEDPEWASLFVIKTIKD